MMTTVQTTDFSDLAESLLEQARRFAFTLPDDTRYFEREGYQRNRTKDIWRILGERAVVRQVVSDVLACTGPNELGYTISVFDGEQSAAPNSRSCSAIMDAIMSSDENVLLIRSVQSDADPVYHGRILLLYGSGSAQVIADYSPELRTLLVAAQAMGEGISDCA